MEQLAQMQDAIDMAKKKPRISLGPPKRIYIKEWREHRGLTQEQLGDRLDKSASHISQLERGVMNYTRETLEALAYALQCEPADLLGTDPNAPKSELWRVITRLPPEQQAQALRLVKAITEEAA